MTYPVDNKQAIQDRIQICWNYYRGDDKETKYIDTIEQTYNAIRWYTDESFLYRLVNKVLRAKDLQGLFMLHLFIRDMSRSLFIDYQILKERQKNGLVVVSYRGFQRTRPDLYYLKFYVVQKIVTNGFCLQVFWNLLLATLLSKQRV